MHVLVLNGPNLNMLSHRDSEHYGTLSLDAIESMLRKAFPEVAFEFFQSNHEGELIERIHRAVKNQDIQGVMANFGGFTHTSVAIRDALAMLTIPRVEVHLSNIHAREEFRHTSLTGAVCNGIIAGFGPKSYLYGAQSLLDLIQSAP
ncbi:MAG: type II 3-dehydroquinate dehydratase [Bacteroidetes bacterium]|nr:type II 3-dehydroquinate dehydratase [Bacteroidota bacterium]MCH8524804.1 type II 3-dehydroquinate dehydratase [Balneolales bacterium]